MKVGDLVALRLCQQAGKVGMITCIPKQSYLARRRPELGLYMVLTNTGNQCFTGNQLIRHSWMKSESR